MLNKGSPANETQKADLTKIKKLEAALAWLKFGEENYYVITKLSSIKAFAKMKLYGSITVGACLTA